jgi:hypothetical protein
MMIVCNKCGNDSCTCDVSADTSHEVTSSLWMGGYRCNTSSFDIICRCAEEDQHDPELKRTKRTDHVTVYSPVRSMNTEWMCSMHDQYLGRAVYIIKCPLRDAEPTLVEVRMATIAAQLVARAIERDASTLVTCMSGLNRSGLVAGLALRMLGWHPDDAITRIRSARGALALSNKWFRKIVKEFDQL